MALNKSDQALKKIFNAALSIVRPSQEESLREIAFSNMLIERLQAKIGPEYEVVLTGSVAKRTFLRRNKDVDIFVLFDRSVPKEQLEGKIKNLFHCAFPGISSQVSYAEHPYVRFHLEGRLVDLVPAYKISDSSERISAVDRSVLHTKFVRENLRGPLIGEVLLLKSFLKANSLYGAEIKIQGFSGYLCELLIIRYGSFLSLIRSASKWKPPIFLDLLKIYNTKDSLKDALAHLGSPYLVVIDPTDQDRNVAAAVSIQTFIAFRKLCSSFLENPSVDFFTRTPQTFNQKLMEAHSIEGASLFIITMPRPNVVDDVLWGQLRKLMQQLEVHLISFGPKAIFADDNRHIIRIALALSRESLPKFITLAGPPIDMRSHVNSFKKMHPEAKFSITKGKVFATKARDKTTLEQFVLDFFRKYGKTSKSHIAYHEDMVVLERARFPVMPKFGITRNSPLKKFPPVNSAILKTAKKPKTKPKSSKPAKKAKQKKKPIKSKKA